MEVKKIISSGLFVIFLAAAIMTKSAFAASTPAFTPSTPIGSDNSSKFSFAPTGEQQQNSLNNSIFEPTNLFTGNANSTPAFTLSTPMGSDSICSGSSSGSPWLQFSKDAAKVGLPIFLIDIITSTLADPPSGGGSILGFGINFKPGGALEPLDEASDYLFSKWLQVVFYGFLASIAVWTASYLVDVGITLNLSLSQSAVITTGYGIIMALVNISFVIGMVWIAFATMFRKAGWDAQSVLMRLVIALLLVNFSLFFALGVAKVGTGLTKVFVSGSTTPGSNLASTYNVATIYCSVAKFMQTTNVNGADVNQINLDKDADDKIKIDGEKSKSFWGKYIVDPIQSYSIMVVGIILAVILTMIGALTLTAIFLFLIVRYVWLTILLIFAPIAWLGFAFPKLNLPGIGNAWSGWWTTFLRWTFLGPLLAFLLYLTTQMVLQINDSDVTGLGLGQGLVQMIVITIFSLAGLYAANKLSVQGANIAYGIASKMGGATLAGLKESGIQNITRTGNYLLTSRLGMKTTASMQKTPGLKLLGKQLNILGSKTEKIANEDKFKDLSSQRLAQMVPALYGPDRVAALSKLAKGGNINKLKNLDNYLNKGIEAQFKSYGKDFSEIEKTIGMNIATYQALRKGEQDKAKEESMKFFKGLSQKDISKLRINDSYDDDKKDLYGFDQNMNRNLREVITFGLVNNSGYVNKAASGIKSKNFPNYKNEILLAIPKLPENISTEVKKSLKMMVKNRELGNETIDAETKTPT